MTEEPPVIVLRTLTRLWRFAQYLYTAAGISLVVPISQTLAKWTLGVFLPIWGIMHILGISWERLGLSAHFLIPGAIVWAAVWQAGEGGRPIDSARSWLRAIWWMFRAGVSTDPFRPLHLVSVIRVTDPDDIRPLCEPWIPRSLAIQGDLQTGSKVPFPASDLREAPTP